MENELFNKIGETLWSDIRGSRSFETEKPLLAHYTSIEALESIARDSEFWFSNPLYMNDWEELSFGMDECAPELVFHDGIRNACADSNLYDLLCYHFETLLGEFREKHAFDTYVLCFSEHKPDEKDGRLSMWRGYGAAGAGVALVLKSSAVPIADPPLLIIDAVEYASKSERRARVTRKLDLLAAALAGEPQDEGAMYFVAKRWVERMKLFSLFSKHSGFSEEHEWRAVYLRDWDESDALADMLGYTMSPRGIVPKLKLKVGPIPSFPNSQVTLEDLVDRIILGPTISRSMNVQTVVRMLEKIGRGELAKKVQPSEIPFRPNL